MMIEFQKYPSIKNLEYVDFSRYPAEVLDATWYKTEKIHGTNMSIIVSPDDHAFAAREHLLDDDSELHRKIITHDRENIDKIIVLAKNFLEDRPEYSMLHIFGEGFGAGIQYMNYRQNHDRQKEFKIFDVFARRADGSGFTVLPLPVILKVFGEENFVPIEAYGNIRDLIESEDLDAPSNYGGEREGVVYKLVEPSDYNHKSDSPFYNAIKYKTGKFKEIVKKIKREKSIVVFSEHDQALLDDVISMVTPARVDNIMSHHGWTKYNFDKISDIIKAMYKDIFAEYPHEIKPDDGKNFNKALSRPIAKTVREKFEITL